jgi:hypothetical protein
MKKNIKYFMMAAVALLSMSACNNEMDEQDPANNGKLQPVQFQTSIAGTRTSTTPDHVTTFANGDEIGLFVYAENGVIGTDTPIYSNVKLTYSDGTWTSETPIYPEVAYDYYAYYPYQANTQEGINPTKIAINVNPNQNVVNNYNVSDVLATDKIAATINATTVNLSFKHAYAMIEAKISGSLVSAAPTSVVLNNVKTEASLTLGSPSAGVAEGAAADVTMGSINEDATSNIYTYRAVVPAQDIAGGGTLITVTLADGKKYQMKAAASGAKYVAAKYTLLDVNIGTAKPSVNVTTNDQSISAWEGNGSIAENTTEIIKAVTSLTDFGLTTGLTVINKGAYSNSNQLKGEENGWFGRYEEGKSTITIGEIAFTEPSNGLTVTLTSDAANGWNKNAFCYRYTKPFEQAEYILTIKAKPTAGTTSVAGGVLIRTADDSHCFGISIPNDGGIKGVNTFTLSEEKTMTVRFNLLKKTTKVSAQPITPTSDIVDTTSDDVQAINIYFYCNTKGSSLDITPISLIKVAN